MARASTPSVAKKWTANGRVARPDGVVAGDPDGAAMYGVADRIWNWWERCGHYCCYCHGFVAHIASDVWRRWIRWAHDRSTWRDSNHYRLQHARHGAHLGCTCAARFVRKWVPGTLAGLGLAIEKYGRLSLAESFSLQWSWLAVASPLPLASRLHPQPWRMFAPRSSVCGPAVEAIRRSLGRGRYFYEP